jgi:hypothetical protein
VLIVNGANPAPVMSYTVDRSATVALGWVVFKSLYSNIYFHAYYITDISYTGQVIPLISISNQRDRSTAGRIRYLERWRHQSNIPGTGRIRAQSLHGEQSPSVGGQRTIGGGSGPRRG